MKIYLVDRLRGEGKFEAIFDCSIRSTIINVGFIITVIDLKLAVI
jgi:hypothetical protein